MPKLPQEWATLQVDGLHVRAAKAKDWTLTEDGQFSGRAVPFGTEAELFPGLFESFQRGAFAAQVKDPARVKICYRHGDIVGRAMELEERKDGLWVRGKIMPDPARPSAALALADLRDELLDELSIGFGEVRNGYTITEDSSGMHILHTRAALREVSVVPFGAYGRDARVTQVRDVVAAARDARIRELAESILALTV
jgi:hypothetical protein